MKWRLLSLKEKRGAMQMAIDEAILIARQRNLIPNTLRFYTWKPATVTIGFFQSLDLEVDTKKAAEHNIDIVRRYTGGGAVLHEHELTYSLVMEATTNDILQSYEKICGGIVKGLKLLGVDAQFKPINDIIVNGKKISGNAQTRKEGIILQHGTILLDVDIEKMFSILKVPDEKIKDKMIKAAKDRVTSLKDLGVDVNLTKIQKALAKGFEDALRMSLVKGSLTSEELSLAEKLCKDKYSSKEWNCMR